MDSSTLIFILTLAVAFIFLRWLIAPIPESNEFDLPERQRTGDSASGESTGANVRETESTTSTTNRTRRPVTESMIEVVQTIAPALTRDQIIADLNRSGSVEATVEAYMENGNLPYPEGSVHTSEPPAQAPVPASGIKKENLLQKYDIDVNKLDDAVDENDKSLLKKKQEMIIKARKRLEAQLKNEIDLKTVVGDKN